MIQSKAFTIRGTTFQQRYRKCGKPECKCTRGQPHGPYWYKQAPGEQLAYVGKELPQPVAVYLAHLRERAPELRQLLKDLREAETKARREWQLAGDKVRTITALLEGEQTTSSILQALDLATFDIPI